MNKLIKKNTKLSSARMIMLSFLAVIILGALLLMLPFSSIQSGSASFIDSLFTAVSAVCVTGLVVKDTATYWSQFGQFIILILIQIGGMGVMTLIVSILVVSKRKIGLAQRSIMQDAISAPHLQGIVKFTNFIITASFIIELLGAISLTPIFCKDFGAKGIWYAVFHSVSAFCNAGFDLMGIRSPFSSLSSYSGNIAVNIIIIMLIILGGIGFMTWQDIAANKWHFKKYRMQSKVILSTTLVLLIIPFSFFYFYEFADNALMLSGKERLLYSVFHSVTPRTAGFNTADLASVSDAGKTVTIILMLIGGSPGSTAGGMKTTTIAVLFLSAQSVFRRNADPQCFGRRISFETVRNAVAILLMYLVLFLSGGIAISMAEGLPILTCLFETASAIGTVGLTLGITPGLGLFSRIILIVLMFCGRIGGLTLVFAAFSTYTKIPSKLPAENITVG